MIDRRGVGTGPHLVFNNPTSHGDVLRVLNAFIRFIVGLVWRFHTPVPKKTVYYLDNVWLTNSESDTP
jgi:hypothetical protein